MVHMFVGEPKNAKIWTRKVLKRENEVRAKISTETVLRFHFFAGFKFRVLENPRKLEPREKMDVYSTMSGNIVHTPKTNAQFLLKYSLMKSRL